MVLNPSISMTTNLLSPFWLRFFINLFLFLFLLLFFFFRKKQRKTGILSLNSHEAKYFILGSAFKFRVHVSRKQGKPGCYSNYPLKILKHQQHQPLCRSLTSMAYTGIRDLCSVHADLLNIECLITNQHIDLAKPKSGAPVS